MTPDEKSALRSAARPGFLAVTRARVLPVALVPALTGSAAAWARAGLFSWTWFAVTIGAATAGHLAFNLLHDVADLDTGAEDAARAEGLSVPTSSGLLSAATYPRARALRTAAILLLVAAAGGVAIAVERSVAAAGLGVAAFALAWAAVAPPLRFGSRAPGLAEAATVLACVMQSAAAFAAQAGRPDAGGYAVGLVPGLLTALVVFHQGFLRFRSDVQAGVPNTVSRLGPERAMAVSAVAIAVTFAVLAAQAALGVWEVYALAAILGGLPLFVAYIRAQAEIGPLQNYLTLFGATLGSTVMAGVILTGALVLEGALG